MKKMSHTRQSIKASFWHAFEGIEIGLKERNMKIHWGAMGLVIILSAVFKLNRLEWCICLGLCGFVISLELVNTAIEAVVDLVTESYHPKAKAAKDLAAGAVLVGAISSVLIGGMIFVPKLMAVISIYKLAWV